MPTTRRQTGSLKNDDEKRKCLESHTQVQRRLFDEPPASPSCHASTVMPQVDTLQGPAEGGVVSEPPAVLEEQRRDVATAAHGSKAPSVRSRCSSVAARIQQAELQAAEQLAAIKRRELQLEANLIKKRLEFDISTIREETDRESLPAEVVHERIDEWLNNSSRNRRHDDLLIESDPQQREEDRERYLNIREREKIARANEIDSRRHISQKENDDDRRLPKRQEVYCEAGPRERSPVRDLGVERLADTLDRLMKRRPPPRQAQDLPTFSGAPTEWLPFKAAMRDSTKLFNFSKAENLARLQACLKGEAREAVSALLYNAMNPDLIMRTLEQCFGRPEVIIERTLEDIKRLPRPGTTASDLNSFAIKVQNIVCILDSVDNRGYLTNPMLTGEILEKLSPHLRSRWCEYADQHSSYSQPMIVTLSKFLLEEADRGLRFAYTKAAATKSDSSAARQSRQIATNPRYERKRNVAVYKTDDEKKQCLCCGGEHDVPQCDRFKRMSIHQRWEWLKTDGICFRCVNAKHRRMRCKAKRCDVNDCRRPHHVMLHEDQTKEEPSDTKKTKTVASVNHSTGETEVLLKVCPITIQGPKGAIDTYALLDEGSTITILDEDIANAIGADGPVNNLRISSVNAQQTVANSKNVQITLITKERKRFDIEAKTMKDLSIKGQRINKECLTKYDHLRTLRNNDVCYNYAEPRVLIGADNWHLIITRKTLMGKKDEPVASLTKLGWIIHGSAPRSCVLKESESVLYVDTPRCALDTRTLAPDEELNALMREHFECDSLGIIQKERVNSDDARALRIFKHTTKKVNGRYEVRLPWRTDDVMMPPSYDGAFRRLKGIEKKMDKSDEFRVQYIAQINNLFDKGYATESDGTEFDNPKLWYLPHFAVTNVNKPGKLRLVFDAAARINGVCLNDKLLDGPDLLRDLPGLLLRFRERPIAVTADIREMFLQVNIAECDQPAQMFLWRGDDRTSPPKKYKMKSMIFGARSSPFLAHSVRDLNAVENAVTCPRACEAITKSHYMDDWVDCFETEKEAIEVMKEVTEVHAKAGFILASFNSNSSQVLSTVPEERSATSLKQLGTSQHKYGRTLGLLWDANTDELAFNTDLPRVPEEVKNLTREPTKRQALSAVMSVFDPLGLLSYFTIRAKIILQRIWRLKIEWDEALPSNEASVFREWLSGTMALRSLRLPRLYHQTGGVARKQLHVFCDASEDAYAAAVYWRLKGDQGIMIRLAAAKARVAPMKTQSVPRLELQAAVIGVRLATTVLREHRWKAERVVFWTDSQTVLHWIRNDRVRYTPYVAHRLTEIAETTTSEQWRWVPTHHNVADDATRLNTEFKNENDRWFVGPMFLYDDESTWPTNDVTVNQGTESEHYAIMHTQWQIESSVPDAERFSSYERLVRTMARVLLFVQRCRRRANELTIEHINEAERCLIKQSQRESFPDDIERLSNKRKLRACSRIRKLDPYVDGDGVLRARGRIGAAGASAPDTTPVILDGRHPYARLLLDREHRRAHHSHNERVVNDVRQRYWILRLRPSVRAVAQKCAYCRMRKAKPVTPVFGDLPSARLEPFMRPFTNCGLDFFGPMTVTVGRRHEKRWGALFTCLTTRAVHIELVASLSTDSAIMALRRMAARRGWPRLMYSDNATNFKGADHELRAAVKEWEPTLRDFALTNRIDWRYISPGAPHQGGAWERMIRSVKNALHVTLHEKSPKEEILNTLLAEVEYTLNARPLVHVPVSHDDPEALTPNHFLLGSSTGLPTTGSCAEADKRTWRVAQALADEYWRRWLKEYVPELIPRGGARDTSSRAIQKGDLVIVVDRSLPRNVWPRGIVENVYPGPDGEIRNVDVRTKGGIFRRPTSRLAVLPVEEEAARMLHRGETVADRNLE